jgi:hypothetical protein
MFSQIEALWWFGVLVLPALALVLMRLLVQWERQSLTERRLSAVALLLTLLALVLVLSGCGTAPLPAPIRLWVPAELLTPPAPPVLLTPGSGLRPPGPTIPPTLRLAPATGLGTSV